jgi:hypothetical protein
MSRPVARLALAAAVLGALWLGLRIVTAFGPGAPDADGFAAVLLRLANAGPLYYTQHAAAVGFTLLVTALFGGLGQMLRENRPTLAACVSPFVAVFCGVHLTVALVQVGVAPYLMDGEAFGLESVLKLTIRGWPHSAASLAGGAAFAVLSAPALAYGRALGRAEPRAVRLGGRLVAVAGVLWIAGFGAHVLGWRWGFTPGLGCLVVGLGFLSRGSSRGEKQRIPDAGRTGGEVPKAPEAASVGAESPAVEEEA